eukprot:GHVH01000737.1.p1 GENE.GHVH01000737.1~~GHVH01000737.1.p1  ORF type:complete len:329 (+),score=38.40 GHVH01000737.1:176-1162(+)
MPVPTSKKSKRTHWTFKNANNLDIALYNEKATGNVDRAVLLVHGLQSHYALEYCTGLELNSKTGEYTMVPESDNSWTHQLVDTLPNCSVFGMDMQGHGSSGGWGGRTNVHDFNDYGNDVIMALKEVAHVIGSEVPICLVGISLGGAVVCRAMELLGKRESKPAFRLAACCLLAPAVSIELLKLKPINRITLPLAPLLSMIMPTVKCGQVEEHPLYPMIDRFREQDQRAGKGKVAARLAAECVRICDVIMNEAAYFAKGVPGIVVHFIHSEADRFVDPDGSRQLYSKIQVVNKKLTMLPEKTGMWHYLTLEPGSRLHVLPLIIDEIEAM